jgi:voltage-gated potassium channel
MQADKEDTFNVMFLTLAITVVVLFASIFILWFFTKDVYLDIYFALEAFFEVQNTAASTELATIAFAHNTGQFLPILVVVIVDNLSRILIVSFILAAVIDLLEYANVEGLINGIKARTLRGHVIICGYNEISERLITKLKSSRIPYIVIARQRNKNAELNEKRVLNVFGDFLDEDTLKDAGISRARAVIFASENDVENVMGALTARRSNKKIKIVSRLGDENVRRKVYGIGVNMAVIPEHLAGLEMGEFISKSYGA